MLDIVFSTGIDFGRALVGIILRPYETYRRIGARAHMVELVYIAGLLAAYFALASLVKTAAFAPFLLTHQFIVLAASAAANFFVSIGVLSILARLVGGQGDIRRLIVGWGYTLVPTVLWFLATSLLYVLLPPPRTTSAAGIAFSIIFLVFSVMLFFWKATLGYLTLRFTMRLDLGKILIVTGIAVPLLGFYSVAMYRWGIFRVPFL